MYTYYSACITNQPADPYLSFIRKPEQKWLFFLVLPIIVYIFFFCSLHCAVLNYFSVAMQCTHFTSSLLLRQCIYNIPFFLSWEIKRQDSKFISSSFITNYWLASILHRFHLCSWFINLSYSSVIVGTCKSCNYPRGRGISLFPSSSTSSSSCMYVCLNWIVK